MSDADAPLVCAHVVEANNIAKNENAAMLPTARMALLLMILVP
jgi:hypothetical protein